MTDTLRIASAATGGIDLLDTTKWDRIEIDEPTPDITRATQSGCGISGTRLVKRTINSWSLPMTIMAKGSDGNTRFDNRNTLIAELEAAVATELGSTDSVNYDGKTRYVQRIVGNQDPPDIWQVIDYDFSHQRKRDNNKFVTLPVRLVVIPGQRFPADATLTGLTVTSIMGGLGRVVLDSGSWPAHIGML